MGNTFTHQNISVYGDVQGVFLRRTIKHRAEQLGVFGSVQNKEDGSVYIEVEGSEDAVSVFKGWLQDGAGDGPHTIKRVDADEGSFKAFDAFVIH